MPKDVGPAVVQALLAERDIGGKSEIAGGCRLHRGLIPSCEVRSPPPGARPGNLCATSTRINDAEARSSTYSLTHSASRASCSFALRARANSLQSASCPRSMSDSSAIRVHSLVVRFLCIIGGSPNRSLGQQAPDLPAHHRRGGPPM